MPGKRSPEQIEYRLRELFSREVVRLETTPELTFGWRTGSVAAVIRYPSLGRVQTEVNLRFFRERGAHSEGAWEFLLYAGVGGILQRLQLEADGAARTYLHGLARIEVLRERSAVRGVLSLLPGDWPAEQGRRLRFTAADLYCAAAGFRLSMERCAALLSPEELDHHRRLQRELELLCEVPEAVFVGKKLPESSMVRCMDTVSRLPEPARTELCDEQGNSCSLAQLMERYARTGDPLCGGIALRLFALSGRDFAQLLTEKSDIRQSLEGAARDFCRRSVEFAWICGRSEHRILQDELLALERINARLSASMKRHGMPCETGRIHSLAQG